MAEDEPNRVRIETVIGWRGEGFSAEQVAALCHAAGWSPVDIIKMLKKYFDVGIGVGKAMVDRLQDAATRTANDFLRYQAEFVLLLPEDVADADLELMESLTGWSWKLWALVQTDRHQDIEAALARFDPHTLTFPAMSLAAARELLLDEISKWEIEMQLLDDRTSEYEFGWTFTAQSADYVRSGDVLDMAVGHGPFLVDKFTGALWSTGSAFSVDTCIANYRASGDPSRPTT